MHVENQNYWVALGNRIVPQCSLWLPCVYGYWERASLETKLGLASSTKAYLHLCQAVGQLLHILCSFDTQCGIVRYFLRMSSKIMRWMLLNTLLSPKSLQIDCFQIASQVFPFRFCVLPADLQEYCDCSGKKTKEQNNENSVKCG